MTTLYRAVLIESSEQAEALPDETMAYLIRDDGAMDALAFRLAGTDGDPRTWQMMNRFSIRTHDAMVGWTVLVPVEVKETRDEGTGWIVPTAFGPKLMGAYLGSPDDTPAKRYTQTIWRTPWTPTEEA